MRFDYNTRVLILMYAAVGRTPVLLKAGRRIRNEIRSFRRLLTALVDSARLAVSRKKLVFISSGGMGSSYLVRAIRKEAGLHCIEKPFVNTFFFNDYPAAARNIYPGRPVLSGPESRTDLMVKDAFFDTQVKYSDSSDRFEFELDIPIRENMGNFLGFLDDKRVACVLRATSCHDILISNRVYGAVFLLRHPLQAYASYTKPIRHKKDIDALGGSESEDALRFWAWSWNSVAEKYFDCLDNGLNPILLRYEFMNEDLEESRSYFLRRMFKGFSYRENQISLSESSQQKLMELVGPAYVRLYGPDSTGY